jgi:hypothetical protein
MRTTKILAAIVAAAALAACSSSSSDNGGGTPYPGFVQPAGTVAVNFTVDDTANKVYTAGNLKWKGSMIYNATTREITPDPTWSGVFPGGGPLSGWAALTDDGPWTVSTTAHEPVGSTAGDHKWGVTVFVVPPVSGSTTFEYGLIDTEYETLYGNGWIWTGANGTVSVPAGATAPINAPGLVIPAFGTNDIQLEIDTSALDAAVTGVGTTISVKGSAWAWGLVDISGSKTGTTYSFTLSDHIGAGKQFNHTGLLHSGNNPEFIFTFDAMTVGTTTCCASGCDNASPCEYKVSGVAASTGVSAGTRAGTSGTFTPATVSVNGGNNNTYITVP